MNHQIFLNNKYTKWYFSIIENAKNKDRKKQNGNYYELHHIIPESFYKNNRRKTKNGLLEGDPNLSSNKVLLTAKEHFISHIILCKAVCPEFKRIAAAAAHKMKTSNKLQYSRSSLNYSMLRNIDSFWKGQTLPDYIKDNIKKNHWLNNGGKIKESTKILWSINRTGSGNVMYGKKHSEETKRKISEAKKGKCAWNKGIPKSKKEIYNLYKLSKEERSRKYGSAKGKRWYTNGFLTYYGPPGTEPAGYILGRIKKENGKK